MTSRIPRRNFMGVVAGGMAAATAPFGVPAASQEGRHRRPNVIFAFSDEHRWQSMSLAEMPQLKTPNLETLASQGVEFTHCISNYPVCSPYRAILMSGRWPCQQGVIDNGIPLSSEQMTLGKAFQAGGYRTGYIGKWHLGGTRAEPFGFDHSLIWTGTNNHWDHSKYHPKGQEPVTPKGYNATLMTDQAIDFATANQNQPFFLMLSWNPPHSKFTDAPDDMKAHYPEGSLPSRPNVDLADSKGKDAGLIWNQNDWDNFAGYHAHVSAIDRELGRLMQTLDTLGLAEDTILVYTSDHGSMLGSHGIGSKRQPYEESIRVPLIIRWPEEIPRGRKSDALVGAIDLMPTLCGLAALDVPQSCQGQDLAGLVRGATIRGPESQFLMHISKKNASGGDSHPAPIFRGVRTARYTYAVYPDKPWCLFDNETDPYQLNNRLDDPALADVRREHHQMLVKWLRAADDDFEPPRQM
jgi:arylsulfatase A-like enzyme